jgi:hypothetical protein
VKGTPNAGKWDKFNRQYLDLRKAPAVEYVASLRPGVLIVRQGGSPLKLFKMKDDATLGISRFHFVDLLTGEIQDIRGIVPENQTVELFLNNWKLDERAA